MLLYYLLIFSSNEDFPKDQSKESLLRSRDLDHLIAVLISVFHLSKVDKAGLKSEQQNLK